MERCVEGVPQVISSSFIGPALAGPFFASGPYLYRLHHGAHRFYASVAAGFLHIPAIILAR